MLNYATKFTTNAPPNSDDSHTNRQQQMLANADAAKGYVHANDYLLSQSPILMLLIPVCLSVATHCHCLQSVPQSDSYSSPGSPEQEHPLASEHLSPYFYVESF